MLFCSAFENDEIEGKTILNNTLKENILITKNTMFVSAFSLAENIVLTGLKAARFNLAVAEGY